MNDNRPQQTAHRPPRRLTRLLVLLAALVPLAFAVPTVMPNAAEADSSYAYAACGGINNVFTNGSNGGIQEADMTNCAASSNPSMSGLGFYIQGTAPGETDANDPGAGINYSGDGRLLEISAPSGEHFSIAHGTTYFHATNGFDAKWIGESVGSGTFSSADPVASTLNTAAPGCSLGSGTYTTATGTCTKSDNGAGNDWYTNSAPANSSNLNAQGIGIEIICADSATGDCEQNDGDHQGDDNEAYSPAIAAINELNLTVDDPDSTVQDELNSSSGVNLPSPSTGTLNGHDYTSYGISFSMRDPGGICTASVYLKNAAGNVIVTGNVSGQGINSGASLNHGVWNTVSPCSTGTVTGNLTADLSHLPDGTYYWDIDANNAASYAAGQLNTSWTSPQFTVDNTAPTVSITTPDGQTNSTDGTWYGSAANVSVSATDTGAGVGSINCTVDGTPVDNTNPAGYSFTVGPDGNAGGTNATNAIVCNATDAAYPSGNTSGHANASVEIDEITPQLSFDADDSTIPTGQWTSQGGNIVIKTTSGPSGLQNNGLASCTITNTSTGTTANVVPTAGDGTPGTYTSTAYTAYQANGNADFGGASTGNYTGSWSIAINATGKYQLSCTPESIAGLTGNTVNETVELDTTTSDQLAANINQASAGQTPADEPQADSSVFGPGFAETDAVKGDATANGTVGNTDPTAFNGDATSVTFTPDADTSAVAVAVAADNSRTPDNVIDVPANAATLAGDHIASTSCTVSEAGGAVTSTHDVSGSAQNTVTFQMNSTAYQPDVSDCTQTNMAGTTSNDVIYSVLEDQQQPAVQYAQPENDVGGFTDPSDPGGNSYTNLGDDLSIGNNTRQAAAATPSKTALTTHALIDDDLAAAAHAKDAPLVGTLVAATKSNPVPADGHIMAPSLVPQGVKSQTMLSPNDVIITYTGAAGWASGPTTIQADATETQTDAGITGLYCQDTNDTDGSTYPYSFGPTDEDLVDGHDGPNLYAPDSSGVTELTVPLNPSVSTTGVHSIKCFGAQAAAQPDGTGQLNASVEVNGSDAPYLYQVDEDAASVATLTFGGADPAPQVYTGTPAVTATADPNGQLSDVDSIECAIDDPDFGQAGDPNSSSYVNLPTDPTNKNYTVNVPIGTLATGDHIIACAPVSGAGLTGTVTSETLRMVQPITTCAPDNPNCSSSGGNGGGTTYGPTPTPPINSNGQPPYTVQSSPYQDGPPPNTWKNTDQPVFIDAYLPASMNDAIVSLTCDEPPAVYDGAPNETDNGTSLTWTNANPGSNELKQWITVGPGHPELQCYVTDAAGLTYSLGQLPLMIDTSAPTGYIDPPNPAAPSQVSATVTDVADGVEGSGIVNVQMQLEVSGQTISLPLDPKSRTSGDGTYTADTQGVSIPAGSWLEQAVVTDAAGNTATINTLQDGDEAIEPFTGDNGTTPGGGTGGKNPNDDSGTSAAKAATAGTTIVEAAAAGTAYPPLPGMKTTTTTVVTHKVKVRVKTGTKTEKLRAHGKETDKKVPVYSTVTKIEPEYTTVKVTKTETVKVHGKETKKQVPVYTTVKKTKTIKVDGKKKTVVLYHTVKGKKVPETKKVAETKKVKKTKTVSAIQAGVSSKPIALPYNGQVAITGELKTKAGTPLANTNVEVQAKVANTTGYKTIATITTDSNGVYHYRVPGGPSRAVQAVYRGSSTMATTTGPVLNESVTGKTTFTATKTIVHGKKATYSGQVAGGYIPKGGAIVQLWYLVYKKGHQVPTKWREFGKPIHTKSTGAWAYSLTFPAMNTKGWTYQFKATVSSQGSWPFQTVTSTPITRAIR